MGANDYLLCGICAIAGYLLGSVETAIFVSKLKFHDDVRTHGSGNAGTTNMLRVYGKGAGAITFIGDLIKGVVSVLLGYLLAYIFGKDTHIFGYVTGVFAVIGHDFPVFFDFKGGKGVATTFGIAWVISPIPAAIATALGALIIPLSQMVSLGSLICTTVFAALTIILNSSNTALALTVAVLWALAMLRHIDNIKRILKGEENKLFKKKSK